MAAVAPSKRSNGSKLLAASLAFGAVTFVSKQLGATTFLQAAAPRGVDADAVSMQRRALLPAAAVGAMAALQGTEEASAAATGIWKEGGGRLTFESGGKALWSFALPKDNSFYKADVEQVTRAGKDPTQIAVYERKDGAVVEVGPLPKGKDFMLKTKRSIIKPISGQKVIKLEDGPTGGQFEFIEYPQATMSGGFGNIFQGERRTKTNHVWFTSLKDANGEGVLMMIEAPKDSVAIQKGEDIKDEPKLMEIIKSLKLEA